MPPTTNTKSLEEVARYARQSFGDRLPQGVLDPETYKVYERLYGAPLSVEEAEDFDGDVDGHDYGGKDVLLRETTDGGLEEIILEEDLQEEEHEDDETLTPLDADEQLRRDMEAASIEGYEVDEDIEEETLTGESDRAHPLTLTSRFGTTPLTLQLPKDSMVGPVGVMLADMANKHLDEAALKIFGGPGLPYSTGTPLISRSMPQKPIPLSAFHSKMSSIEADIFTAAVMPGTYAAVMSALVESRKRLGTSWIQSLIQREGGPRVLDVGGGGAGALAWREVVKAEWARMEQVPPTLGTTSVLTASPALRERASVLLDNTSFLPRLPDYIHAPKEAQVKQFDIIIAPHSLWHVQEDYLRKQQVQNLWSLLDPAGGLLILVEKGVPRGFEVVAGARDVLIAEPSSAIVAPCTNHSKCPMYLIPGASKGRKDYCHFSQRYIRPPYFQRLLGAKDRNYEDVKFSYVAVQKGGVRDILSGDEASALAFAGYPNDVDVDVDIDAQHPPHEEGEQQEQQRRHLPVPLLPRSIYTPLKRQGHVIMDMCTPAGKLERWTVPKSFGKQAYRDARKSKWGDLWALGAKTRIPRNVRLGKADYAGGNGASSNFTAEESEGDVHVRRRREAKEKGRLKARGRRREETKRLFARESIF